MNTGTSDNWTPYSKDSGATQDIPFINEATGGGNGESVVDTGSYLQFKKKLGNTVGVNQLAKELTTANWTTSDGSISSGEAYIQPTSTWKGIGSNYDPGIVVGHKYLVMITGRLAASGTNVTIGTQRFGTVNIGTLTSTSNQLLVGIFEQASADAYTTISFSNRIGVANFYLKEPKIIDLTLWHGSNDRIPSDLLSHPENWGRYYAGSLDYNAGTLESADGSILKSINRNCWDGEHDVIAIPNQAYYCKGTATITYKDRGGNTISTASVTNASFTTPADCFSFGVSGTGVTISLYYSGESGYDEDYDFSVLAEVDTGSEVLRSAGAVADEKTPDGTITRRVGYVDMGTLNWSAISNNRFETSSPISGAKYYTSITTPNIHCGRYQTVTFKTIYETSTDMCISIWNEDAYVQVRDTSYSTAAAFKTAMSGVYLLYELATPTTEQGTAFAENIPCDDFGSLMWTQTKGIPQGNEIFYPVDYKASFDTLYNIVDGDMSALATDDELQEVADRVPEAPSEDGTYTLKATVSNGTKTYSWVADE